MGELYYEPRTIKSVSKCEVLCGGRRPRRPALFLAESESLHGPGPARAPATTQNHEACTKLIRHAWRTATPLMPRHSCLLPPSASFRPYPRHSAASFRPAGTVSLSEARMAFRLSSDTCHE